MAHKIEGKIRASNMLPNNGKIICARELLDAQAAIARLGGYSQ